MSYNCLLERRTGDLFLVSCVSVKQPGRAMFHRRGRPVQRYALSGRSTEWSSGSRRGQAG